MWNAIQYVSSLLTLLAFLAACGVVVGRLLIRRKEHLIRTAPEAQRATLVEQALEVYRPDLRDLSPDQKFDIVMAEINQRSVQFRGRTILTAIIAFLSAGLAAAAIYKVGQNVKKAPTSPSHLTANPGSQTAALTWDAVASATSYVVHRTHELSHDSKVFESITTTAFTDKGLKNGERYSYVVLARNEYGESGPSNPAEIVPGISTDHPPAKPLRIATLLSGQVRYTEDILESFKASLNRQGIELNRSIDVFSKAGPSQPPPDQEPALSEWSALIGAIKKQAEATPFDYYVGIGTHASMAFQNEMGRGLGAVPFIFLGVTYPTESGLVDSLVGRSERRNIAGVSYGGGVEAVAGVLDYSFPDRRLVYIYTPRFQQDIWGAQRLRASRLAKEGRLAVVETSDFPSLKDMSDSEAIYFSWYTFEYMFEDNKGLDVLKNRLAVATTRENVANGLSFFGVSVNDAEIGQAGAKIVLDHLSNPKLQLGTLDVIVTKQYFWVNQKTARSRGIAIPGHVLEAATEVFSNN